MRPFPHRHCIEVENQKMRRCPSRLSRHCQSRSDIHYCRSPFPLHATRSGRGLYALLSNPRPGHGLSPARHCGATTPMRGWPARDVAEQAVPPSRQDVQLKDPAVLGRFSLRQPEELLGGDLDSLGCDGRACAFSCPGSRPSAAVRKASRAPARA
jgi:hypothetical protein